MHHADQPKITELVQKLQQIFANNLITVCVYGGSLENSLEQDTKHRHIDVLVVLNTLSVEDLTKTAEISRWWNKIAKTLPIFISRAEWQSSQDIFVLEYADIKDQHHIAYGEDLFSNMTIDKKALQLVSEQQLYQKLMFLRQRWLLYHDQPKVLLEVMQTAVSSIAALCRGLLRLTLNQSDIPQNSADVFEALKKALPHYDAEVFLWILETKKPHAKNRTEETTMMYSRFIEALSDITQYADSGLTVSV